VLAGAAVVVLMGSWAAGVAWLERRTRDADPALAVAGITVMQLGFVTAAAWTWRVQRRQVTLARRHSEQTDTIAEAVRSILRHEDGREAIVHAAFTIGAAAAANLFEFDGHGDLVCTSATAEDLIGARVPANGNGVLARCFSSGRPIWTDGPPDRSAVDPGLRAAAETASGRRLHSGAAFPIVASGRCLGVLGLAWEPGVAPRRDRAGGLQLLADEAALALAHYQLILELERLSTRDPLTGVANRRAWEAALVEKLRHALQTRLPLSMLMIDMDHFKEYNDTHGHAAGDQLLREAAASWSARLRPGDVLCRWGGEEFAVLLPASSLDQAVTVAEDLRRLATGDVTCSAGAATWDYREPEAQLVSRADAALYAAKAAGRNRVVAGDVEQRFPASPASPASPAE